MIKYWMVHQKGTSCQYEHPTLESAMKEAERLCREKRGDFYVLEAIKVVSIPVEIRDTIDAPKPEPLFAFNKFFEDKDIPF